MVRQLVVLAVLLASAIGVWFVDARFATSTNLLTVSFLDVGQGDAIFIETPSGVQVLIDGGPDGAVLRRLGGVMAPWDRSIDMVILSHPDLDHIGGIPDVLQRFQVGRILESSVLHDSRVYEAVHREAARHGLSPEDVFAGERFILDAGVYLDILFPDRSLPEVDTNTASVIALLTYGDTTFLMTGDAPRSVERYLVSLYGDRLDVDVLKLGHHGSKTSSDPLFLAATKPAIAVISAGAHNRYGHPHREVLDRIHSLGIATYATMGNGTVTFVSDGKTVVSAE